MSTTTLARFDGTLITLMSIQERKQIVWINTDDDNNCLAVVNSRPSHYSHVLMALMLQACQGSSLPSGNV